jgi:hypothetical protein
MRLASFRHLAVASFFAVAALACTSDGPPTEDEIASALELENGGLDTTDEAPMFGDEATFRDASLEADRTGTDPSVTDPEVIALRERPGVEGRRVLILWGQLPPDRMAEPRVWDGALALNRGALIVRREVGFDGATDAVLARTVRTTVAFTSTTRPFVDGLVLEVLDPEPTAATPLVLTYTPRGGGDSLRFALRELADGPIAYDVGANGDQMVATALRVENDDACDHGFMRGRWHQVRPRLGRFLGVISDEDGATIGHVRGIWGARQNGDRVLFAKYIAVDGSFRGIFNGTWGDGAFRGRWIISTGDHGIAAGRYRESAPGDAVGGHFIGRWAETSCAAGI